MLKAVAVSRVANFIVLRDRGEGRGRREAAAAWEKALPTPPPSPTFIFPLSSLNSILTLSTRCESIYTF